MADTILTQEQRELLEAKLNVMAQRKKELRAAKGTPEEREARSNMLAALTETNDTIASFNIPNMPDEVTPGGFKMSFDNTLNKV